jgi:predicted Zn-dependent protease with MMP-like domain
LIIFPAVPERPDGYPDTLPFIPHQLVEITEFEDAVVMKWFGVDRPFDVMQQLAGASVAEGWTALREEGEPADAGTTRRRYILARLERELEVLPAGPFTSVILRQRRHGIDA